MSPTCNRNRSNNQGLGRKAWQLHTTYLSKIRRSLFTSTKAMCCIIGQIFVRDRFERHYIPMDRYKVQRYPQGKVCRSAQVNAREIYQTRWKLDRNWACFAIDRSSCLAVLVSCCESWSWRFFNDGKRSFWDCGSTDFGIGFMNLCFCFVLWNLNDCKSIGL